MERFSKCFIIVHVFQTAENDYASDRFNYSFQKRLQSMTQFKRMNYDQVVTNKKINVMNSPQARE